jgi:hypothetical protein
VQVSKAAGAMTWAARKCHECGEWVSFGRPHTHGGPSVWHVGESVAVPGSIPGVPDRAYIVGFIEGYRGVRLAHVALNRNGESRHFPIEALQRA